MAANFFRPVGKIARLKKYTTQNGDEKNRTSELKERVSLETFSKDITSLWCCQTAGSWIFVWNYRTRRWRYSTSITVANWPVTDALMCQQI